MRPQVLFCHLSRTPHRRQDPARQPTRAQQLRTSNCPPRCTLPSECSLATDSLSTPLTMQTKTPTGFS